MSHNHNTARKQEKTRIMMVDDHPLMREGMARFLNLQDDLDLCCEAGSVEEALAVVVACNPALAIIDISLHGESGLDLIKTLRRRYPGLALLAISMHDESVFAERALRAGANGYLMKKEATGNILLAVRRVLAGDIYPSPIAGLSEREFEILHLLGLGFGTRQIADKLNRSIKTIEAHRASLKDKLQLKSGADVVRFAIQWLEDR